jgi:hypothetical protein
VTVEAPGIGDVVVQLDVFPADAMLPDGATTYLNVRVTVADGVLQLWRNENPAPAVVFTSPLVAWSGDNRTGWILDTEAGTIVAGRNGGCTCGARLGTAELWPGRRRINTSL